MKNDRPLWDGFAVGFAAPPFLFFCLLGWYFFLIIAAVFLIIGMAVRHRHVGKTVPKVNMAYGELPRQAHDKKEHQEGGEGGLFGAGCLVGAFVGFMILYLLGALFESNIKH